MAVFVEEDRTWLFIRKLCRNYRNMDKFWRSTWVTVICQRKVSHVLYHRQCVTTHLFFPVRICTVGYQHELNLLVVCWTVTFYKRFFCIVTRICTVVVMNLSTFTWTLHLDCPRRGCCAGRRHIYPWPRYGMAYDVWWWGRVRTSLPRMKIFKCLSCL